MNSLALLLHAARAEHLAEKRDTGPCVLHRIDAEIDEDHRHAGLHQRLRDLAAARRAVAHKAENGEVGLHRQNLLDADALFRSLADEGNVAHFRETRGIGLIGVRIHHVQIVLPRNDSSAMAPLRKLDFSPSLISPIYSTSGGVSSLRISDSK
jgi:hypothetical protein